MVQRAGTGTQAKGETRPKSWTVAKEGSRKHGSDDGEGETSILDLPCLPLTTLSQGFLTQTAASGGWQHLDQSHFAEPDPTFYK